MKHAVNAEPLIHQLNNYGREQIQVFQQTLNNFGSDDEGKKFCIADSYREDSECGMLMRESKPPSWISFQVFIHPVRFLLLFLRNFSKLFSIQFTNQFSTRSLACHFSARRFVETAITQ